VHDGRGPASSTSALDAVVGDVDDPVLDDPVLDDPVAQSLLGRHRHLARRVGGALSYLPEVATFSAVLDAGAGSGWSDLARLLGPGELADLFTAGVTPPADWSPVFGLAGVQLVGPAVLPVAAGPAVVELGQADVPAMLELAERTRPGPFWPRTIELGTYLGVRERGELVAMAGTRLRPPGWTEISAVCTAPHARGRGYAAGLVCAVAQRITDRGERPFLHAVAGNVGAIALYERLGFTVRRQVHFAGYRVPAPDRADLPG
jgi:GNAT superfamily N-acetyltransferase